MTYIPHRRNSFVAVFSWYKSESYVYLFLFCCCHGQYCCLQPPPSIIWRTENTLTYQCSWSVTDLLALFITALQPSAGSRRQIELFSLFLFCTCLSATPRGRSGGGKIKQWELNTERPSRSSSSYNNLIIRELSHILFCWNFKSKSNS